MKLVWLSDVHLCWLRKEKIEYFADSLWGDDNGPDVIVITGDVSDGKGVVHDLDTLVRACKKNNPDVSVYFVSGNHDFYGSSVVEMRKFIHANRVTDEAYLTDMDTVKLSANTCLVGTDGWCDAVLGDMYGNLVMSDWYQIAELRDAQHAAQRNGQHPIEGIAAACRAMAASEAKNLKKKLNKAVKQYDNIIVATHIPPWKDATWHEGKVSNDTYLPWFSSYVMGNMLEQFAIKYPTKGFTVLCGHTHGGGIYNVLDNMTCYTAQADYGSPSVAGIIEVDDYYPRMTYFDNPYSSET